MLMFGDMEGRVFSVSIFTCVFTCSKIFCNSRLDNEIMQLQQEINAIDAVRANSTRNRNKAPPTVPEVGLNPELFSFVLMLVY